VSEAIDSGLLRGVLRDSLELWGIAGSVVAGFPPVAAEIRAADGTIVWIERAAEGAPFRWNARSRTADEAPGNPREKRPRPCASLVGLLHAVRRTLGVDRGAALRVAPAPRNSVREGEREESLRGRHTTANAQHPGDDDRIPVSILTGFLGSGKTTLLRRLLRHPEMGRTAVVVNEFGEVGLDHELIETSDETLVTLSTGCLCCKVRSDLALTLADLAARRAAGRVPRFERVVIETSGLADPAPILHALMIDPELRERYVALDVITTVDALTGSSTLQHHPESLKQAALADCLVLTKTDVRDADDAPLITRLTAVNPRAPVLRVVRGEVAPSALLQNRSRPVSSIAAPAISRSSETVHGTGAMHEHSTGISTFTLVSGPMHAATLTLFLSVLAENCGGDLLRLKGIVAIAEEPERPAVIHGVQHVYHAPEWLDRWPSGDRRTRIVFIGRNIPESWVRSVLELLEIEVKDTLKARSRAVV